MMVIGDNLDNNRTNTHPPSHITTDCLHSLLISLHEQFHAPSTIRIILNSIITVSGITNLVILTLDTLMK